MRGVVLPILLRPPAQASSVWRRRWRAAVWPSRSTRVACRAAMARAAKASAVAALMRTGMRWAGGDATAIDDIGLCAGSVCSVLRSRPLPSEHARTGGDALAGRPTCAASIQDSRPDVELLPLRSTEADRSWLNSMFLPPAPIFGVGQALPPNDVGGRAADNNHTAN